MINLLALFVLPLMLSSCSQLLEWIADSTSSTQAHNAAPDFTLVSFDGQEIQLSGLRGKVVIINFWASWSGPCRVEAPIMQNIWQSYRDRDVIVIGVNSLDLDANALEFINEFSLTYFNGPDIGSKISDLYGVQGIPETFIIGKEGNIAEFIYAPTTEKALSDVIESALRDEA